MACRAAVSRWHRASGGAGAGARFGDKAFWQQSYEAKRAAREWFVGAETAAAGAAAACEAHGVAASPRVLHAGCGVSRLGESFARAVPGAAVVNADASAAALAQLEAATRGAAQRFRAWDAFAAAAPPPGAPYDVVLDKGTLDAAIFAGEAALVNYCAALRLADFAVLCHWSDEPPEVRGELLRAAFPEAAVSWAAVDDGDAAWDYFAYVVAAPR